MKRAEGILAVSATTLTMSRDRCSCDSSTLGEGADDTRRRVLQSELEHLAVDRGMLRAVLDRSAATGVELRP